MAKILIVDDSALMRKKLRELLEPHGHDVHIARDGADALEKARYLEPDLITLDINMPKLDGLTALAALLAENPRHKVIMFSSLTQQGTQATMEALALGAFDFLPKPGGTISMSLDAVESALLNLVNQAIGQGQGRADHTRQASRSAHPRPVARQSQAKVSSLLGVRSEPERSGRPAIEPTPEACAFNLTLIGVSTGGPKCVEGILKDLPANYPNPILIAQHMPAGFTEAFANRLDSVCALKVQEVSGSEVIQPGRVYIAKGGSDMTVVRRNGHLLAQRRPSNSQFLWHPSVSLMVESAMKAVPARQITAVMLTGMGYDGANEMAALRRAGGYTIAESDATSVVFGMPKELIERDGADRVLDNHLIAQHLIEISQTRRRHHGLA